ncbi:MAG TPA: class I SAM-dependent RNA methyltransferase [Firmicutes bacterium]|nr:class I SAM-dependent RNA methyltransferase [Bacillota bacterium]
MDQFLFCTPCHFGLESVLAGEIRRLGGENVTVTDGKITFSGGPEMLVKANLWLRTAERVQLVVGSFRATSFVELFDQTAQLPFENYIGRDDAFPVKGWSLDSQLFSVSDCQSIIKRAVVRRFETVYHQQWFEETGPVHQIQFSIHKDQVTILLDTSGPGLHKRGYRLQANEAPISETLAAGMLDLARVYPDTRFYDPFCGSGTFLVEAALKACNIAPGLKRRFSADRWGLVDPSLWKTCREEALAVIRKDATFQAYGSDLDPAAVELSIQNAKRAGVVSRVHVVQRDVAEFVPPEEGKFLLMCNPPYGERMMTAAEVKALYRTMGKVFSMREGANYFIISPDEEFEEAFGRPADKRRKLYNGMIKCQLYMYFRNLPRPAAGPNKPRPPKGRPPRTRK